MVALPEDEADRIRHALKAEPVGWREVTRRGQTNASHWLVELPDGSSAFAKSARGDDTASWIRDEHMFYAETRGAPFLPRLLGWHDDGERPVIVLEDLSNAYWPPPWDTWHVDAVLACLAEVAATPPPPDLPSVVDSQFDFQGWIEPERQHLHPRRPRPADRLELRLPGEPGGGRGGLASEPPRRGRTGTRRDPA
jgi:hypothetical protein